MKHVIVRALVIVMLGGLSTESANPDRLGRAGGATVSQPVAYLSEEVRFS